MTDLAIDLGPAQAVLAAKGKPFHELVRLARLDPATDFRGANLSGMNLHGADLRGYDLSGADLRGTSFITARRDPTTRITQAILDPWDADMMVRGRAELTIDPERFVSACYKAKHKAARLREVGYEWRDALAAHAGNFRVVYQVVRLDEVAGQLELEVYRLAEASGSSDPQILGTFANFMDDVYGDIEEAERLYRAALEADPRRAITLGNFALFMENRRGNMEEAEQLYRAARKAGPRLATNLSNFALFMKNVRGNMEEAEQLYRAALKEESKNTSILANFASFMETVRGDIEEAERLYRAALKADPRHANNLGNYARLLIATGREGEVAERIDAALVHAGKGYDPLRLECWFYRYAVLPRWREEALAEVERLLRAGVSSPGWDLSGVTARARDLGHPDPERLEALAAAISRPKGAPLPEGLFKD